jgi:ketohexokinase
LPTESTSSASSRRILAVGIATLDLINRVAVYPDEDAEVRAESCRRARGGNATNTLVALSQWGHACTWAGTCSTDADGDLVLTDLRTNGVATGPVRRVNGCRLPTSYIVVSRATGSRTIVHYRDLPEYSADDFDAVDPTGFDWIHFEGRNPAELVRMLQRVRRVGGPRCSLEIEKPRPGIERAVELADLVLYSRHYVRGTGGDAAAGFLRRLPDGHPEAYCAWGESGAWVRSRDGEISHSPAFAPPRVVDTLAAGDVFNAGVIDARLRGWSCGRSVEWACRVAGYKCGLAGLDGLAGAVFS